MVFARSGYQAASMDEIASRADVSKPLLYAYFESKEGLYLAYIARTGGDLLDRLVRAEASERRALPRLRAPIREFLAFVEEHRDGWTVLFTEMTSLRPVAEEVAQLRQRIVDAVRQMIAHEARRGSSADAVAHAIVGAGESLANWWLAHPDVERERVVGFYVQVVRATLSTPGITA
jgi:AcrR family transcriptional regulator